MVIKAFNLDEVKQFKNEIEKIKCKLKDDHNYHKSVINHGENYEYIKKFFKKIIKPLQYTEKVDINNFYRIRKIDTCEPFTDRKELIYPKPDKSHEDRMNNTKFRVLYVSLNEYTAMAETRIDNNYIGGFFQLTRFLSNNSLTVFKLGRFSELYLNSPRDSDYVKNKMKDMFDSDGHDRTIQGYSALECAIADILYSTDEDSHLLSSILADAIFTINPSIDAIMYPSMQNRYGINLAIKKECADSLTISYSSLNQLEEVYPNGFFKYYTKFECLEFDNQDSFEFDKVDGNATFR